MPIESGVAIVGMACRLPGADTIDAFWSNLCRGVESITFFSDGELIEAGIDPALVRHPSYVKAAPVLSRVDMFDASFFGYSPREAALVDPQQRLFLEVSWEAFEDAGYHPPTVGGSVGVFAGGGGVVTSYLTAHPGHPALERQTASLAHLGNDKDFLSTRVSYKLNLRGPSLTVQTACSTSLVAVHLACASLRAGESDAALAGASTVRIPQVSGYVAEKGNVHSRDGHCRAFDAGGQGTIFGSGVAAVLLKRVEDAVRDGDHIYALIRGTAVNNDGAQKASYTAPSVDGQARAMTQALAAAKVPAETIGYVECHATGTTVGDPLEIEALTRAFRATTGRTGFCAIGSVKTNIGHPEQTAGLVGMIKAALVLRHGAIPPSLHFSVPNPRIDFDQTPFVVNATLRPWPRGEHPRRAAVNSLGIGGTNAFAVLEEPPTPEARVETPRPAHLFTLSARSEPALAEYATRVRAALGNAPGLEIQDVCETANESRSQFPWRIAVTVGSVAELSTKLDTAPRVKPPAETAGRGAGVAFLFTGQGSQYAGMGAELYGLHPRFREAIDRCDALLRSRLDRSLIELLFSTPATGGSPLDDTVFTQPALFAIEYALADLWRSWGIVPAAVMGHSVGELTAACVGGALTLEDGLRLVAERGRLMQSLTPEGAMAAVRATEETVRQLLPRSAGSVTIAGVNSPTNTVISGERTGVRRVVAHLRREGLTATELAVTRGFHSSLMDPVLQPLDRAAHGCDHRPLTVPLVSNVTGRLMEQLTPDHWSEHARQPVRFADGMRALHDTGCRTFIEIGPGTVLLAMGRQGLPDGATVWLPSLTRGQGEWATMQGSLERLYLAHHSIDWREVHRGVPRRRVSLPTYPFQRQRYWLEPGGRPVTVEPPADPTPAPRSGSEPRPPAEGSYDLDRLPFLRDHRVSGAIVLPTVAALETAVSAGRQRFGPADVVVRDVLYHRALALDDGSCARFRLESRPGQPHRAAFELTSDGNGYTGRVHLTGIVERASENGSGTKACSLSAIRDRCRRELPADAYYAGLRRLGLEYGATFRNIERLWRGRDEVLAQVTLGREVPLDGFAMHPALLDACLHVYPALLSDGDGATLGPDQLLLPAAVERFRLYRSGARAAFAHAVLRPSRDDATTVDIRVYDPAGASVATIEGLTLRRVEPVSVGHPAEPSSAERLYVTTWKQLGGDRARGNARVALGGTWLIYADRRGVGAGLAREIEAAGGVCHLAVAGRGFARLGPRRWRIDPTVPAHARRVVETASARDGLRAVVYLWSLDGPGMRAMRRDVLERAEALTVGGALFLHQALAAAPASRRGSARVWLVTRGAQRIAKSDSPEPLQAMLWGFGRTLAVEAPGSWGGLIDLPARGVTVRADALSILGEVVADDGEDQVAVRGGRRFGARLAPSPLEDGPPPTATSPRPGTYLITGGTGMLGLRVARWLVDERGVRSLVLTSRTGESAQARSSLAALRARGARVDVIAADVSVERDVRRVMRALRALPPLRGVVHSAGVLDDGILATSTWEKFARVTAPKVRGGWLLHHYTRRLRLDLFLVQSSLLSVTGSAGQANYTAANAFLDGLVGHRRARGLAATAINWGPWDEGGMARASGRRGEAMWKSRGVSYIAPASGVALLPRLIDGAVDHTIVTRTDWPVFVRQFRRPPPFYSDVVGSSHETVEGGPSEANGGPPPAAVGGRRAAVLEAVGREVMAELGFDAPVDVRQPLNELGLDSLMSITLANRLEAALGLSVPVVQLIRGSSIEQLVDSLLPAETARGLAPAAVRRAPPAASAVRTSSPATGGWLVVPRPNPRATTRLFCFPFAGGGAATYRSWAASLDETLELVAIEPPGRATRIHEKPLRTLDAFVERLAGAMRPLLDRPAAFLGHCLGGLTAFETARRLRRDGGFDFRHLFVSASRTPRGLAREGPFEQRLMSNLLKLDAFDPLRPTYEQPDDVFAEVIRHFNIGATDEFLREPELRRLLLPAVRADFAMASRYRFTPEAPWPIPITCFVGFDDPYVPREEAMAWGEHTRTAFRLHLRDGAHFMIVEDSAFMLDTINRELAG